MSNLKLLGLALSILLAGTITALHFGGNGATTAHGELDISTPTEQPTMPTLEAHQDPREYIPTGELVTGVSTVPAAPAGGEEEPIYCVTKMDRDGSGFPWKLRIVSNLTAVEYLPDFLGGVWALTFECGDNPYKPFISYTKEDPVVTVGKPYDVIVEKRSNEGVTDERYATTYKVWNIVSIVETDEALPKPGIIQ